MNVVMHAGFAKAGSTTIQLALAHHVKALKRSGFLLFDENLVLARDGEWRGVPQWKIQTAADNGAVLTPEVARQLEGFEGTAIISTENLEFPHMPALFAGLDDMVEVTIVFYMRPQAGYIPSAWKQWFSKDGTPLKVFVERCLKKGKPNYLQSIEAWRKGLPRARIIVRPFVTTSMVGGGPASDFFSLIGFTNYDGPVGDVANQSLDFSLTHLMMRNAGRVFEDIHDNRLEIALSPMLPPIYRQPNVDMLSTFAVSRIADRFRDETVDILGRYCGIENPVGYYDEHFLAQATAGKSYMDMTEREILSRAFCVLLDTLGEERMATVLGAALDEILPKR